MAEKPKTSRRNRKSKPSTVPWVTYERCFVMTLGGFVSGVAALAVKIYAGREGQGPDWLPVFLFCLFLLGIFLFSVGITASRKDTGWMARDSTVHEVVLIVWVVAAPLYSLLKAIEKRRK